jgi:hypothetical protein
MLGTPKRKPGERPRLPGLVAALSSFRRRGRPLYRLHVNVEERFLLVALLLVLFPQPDYFSKNLHVVAIALGFRVDFLLRFGELTARRITLVVIRRVRFAGPIIPIIGQPSDELSDAAADD